MTGCATHILTVKNSRQTVQVKPGASLTSKDSAMPELFIQLNKFTVVSTDGSICRDVVPGNP
jgi:hypothetical protein